MSANVIVVDRPAELTHRSLFSRIRPYGWLIWAVILGAILLCVLFPNVIAPFDHAKQAPRDKFLSPWSTGARGLHLFGTDELGRDVFSKVVAGARLTLFIGLMSTLIGATIGATLGMIAGLRGGWIDRIVMRLTEAQTAMPMFLIALLLLSTLGPSVWNLIMILPTYVWPTFARLIRAETLRMRTSPFIEAAESLGCRTRTILWRHLLPNLWTRVAVLAAVSVGQVILSEAGLSFIGAGVQRPDVTWGLLISQGRKYLTVAWWATVFPGLFAGLTVFAINAIARRFSQGRER
ncbi:MAG TPA: ABC transporter permease [Ilumatobacteraceae bacterium]|nr:ABC transporter permease [Ilumatobacteraceae bacterium]